MYSVLFYSWVSKLNNSNMCNHSYMWIPITSGGVPGPLDFCGSIEIYKIRMARVKIPLTI